MLTRRPDPTHRFLPAGFTLIELMIAVAIFLLLTVMTLVSVNFTLSSDRINGGARQTQSLLAGARDRAIHARAIRGVRLLLDPNNSHLVTGMIYLGAPELFTDGTVTFDPSLSVDATGSSVFLGTGDTAWTTLANQGLIGLGSRIQIPRDSGQWYRIASKPQTVSGRSFARLDRPCRALAGTATPTTYALELKPNVLAGAVPVSLPRGVVIDLDSSRIPGTWRPSTFAGSYSAQMDILFSPRGVVIGEAAAEGQLHLVLADLAESEKWSQISGRSSAAYNNLPFVPANDPTSTNLVVDNDRLIVTVATRTGRVTTHPVNVVNTIAASSLQADDPYLFAEIGEVAKQ